MCVCVCVCVCVYVFVMYNWSLHIYKREDCLYNAFPHIQGYMRRKNHKANDTYRII